MKIGIVTPFNSGNVGTLLQAFATQRVINNLGYDADVVDYSYRASNNPFLVSNLVRRGLKNYLMAIAGHLLRLPKRKRILAFIGDNLKLSVPVRDHDELCELNGVYDYFLVGSDAVWNTGPFGLELAYLLDFVFDNNKKGNYASSFGSSNVPEEHRGVFERYLSEFRFLSVREVRGQELIRGLIGREVPVVLDPTLLLDSGFWSGFAEKSELRFDRGFIFVAEYSISEKLLSDALVLADKFDCDIVCAFPPKGKRVKARVLLKADPCDFMFLIKNARFVLTDSFHVSVFSVNFNTSFMSYVTDRTKVSASRFESAFGLFGLMDRLVYDNSEVRSECLADSYSDVDFEGVNLVLEREREASMGYLREQLDEVSRTIYKP